jgi:hypothetical protein
MVSRTDDAFPHISPRELAVAASFNAPYSAVGAIYMIKQV